MGTQFDKKFNFDIHIRKVVEKLSKQRGIVYKLRETWNTSHLPTSGRMCPRVSNKTYFCMDSGESNASTDFR